jgi:hypothetical protein
MAMLAKGKEASEKKDEKKKHKHPAAKQEAPPSQAPEEGGDADADDQEDGAQEQSGGDAGNSTSESEDAQGQPDGDDDNEQQGGSDQQQDGGGSQGGQGATPVPNPQAPGAGDDTSGGADTPTGEGDTGGGEAPAGEAGNTPEESTNMAQQVPMSPGLKDEYDRANTMLMQELYGSPDDAAAKGIVGGLQPDGPMKIRSAVHLSLVVTTEIIKKLGAKDFPAQLVLPFSKDVVSHVMDLGQQVKQIQYSEQESVAILGALYEGIMRIFGVNHGQAKKAGSLFGKKALMGHAAKHKAALAFAKPGIDALNNAGGPTQGAPQEAGPQTGVAPGSQAAPTSGAPPQPPPPQGGPLAQAAAASPAAQGEGS